MGGEVRGRAGGNQELLGPVLEVLGFLSTCDSGHGGLRIGIKVSNLHSHWVWFYTFPPMAAYMLVYRHGFPWREGCSIAIGELKWQCFRYHHHSCATLGCMSLTALGSDMQRSSLAKGASIFLEGEDLSISGDSGLARFVWPSQDLNPSARHQLLHLASGGWAGGKGWLSPCRHRRLGQSSVLKAPELDWPVHSGRAESNVFCASLLSSQEERL